MSEPYEFFISYDRVHGDLARALERALERHDKPAFRDEDDMPLGVRWKGALEDALRRSKALILIWCCHAARSEYVRIEWERIQDLNRPIVPVRLCSEPVPGEISDWQWIDCQGEVPHTCVEPDDGQWPSVWTPHATPVARAVKASELLEMAFGSEQEDAETAVQRSQWVGQLGSSWFCWSDLLIPAGGGLYALAKFWPALHADEGGTLSALGVLTAALGICAFAVGSILRLLPIFRKRPVLPLAPFAGVKIPERPPDRFAATVVFELLRRYAPRS